jgi:flagellar protein FlaG
MEIFGAVGQQMEVAQPRMETPSTQKPIEHAEIQRDSAKSDSVKERNQNEKKVDEKSLNEAIQKLNKQMEELNTNIQFGFNDKISLLYVDVKERDSGKLIRKIPSEEMMKLEEHMKEIIGVIFDKKG